MLIVICVVEFNDVIARICVDNVEEIRFPEYPHGFVTVKGIQYEVEQSEKFKTLDEVNVALYKCDETKLFGGTIIIGGEDHVKVSRQRIRQFNRKHESLSIEQSYGIKLISRGKYVL